MYDLQGASEIVLVGSRWSVCTEFGKVGEGKVSQCKLKLSLWFVNVRYAFMEVFGADIDVSDIVVVSESIPPITKSIYPIMKSIPPIMKSAPPIGYYEKCLPYYEKYLPYHEKHV